MKVSCKLMGGLGNNLFQISAVLSYSMKHDCDYCIPTVIENPHYKDQKVFYSKYLKYCDDYKGMKCYYNEKGFEYNEIPKQTCEYYILNGYFQSYRYIEPYRNEILKVLDFPYMRETSSCAIHVRRGDYLKVPNTHPVITNEYLEQAQIYMMNKGVLSFIIFSDDVEFCKKSMPQFNDCTYYFSEGYTEEEDLCLASDCENSIGSNSSFSWWIYYLNRNKNKIGIFPKKWFGENLPHDTKDLIMPEMILM